MIMQLSMSIGVTVAGLLLGFFARQTPGAGGAASHPVFFWTYLSMAVIIALPALIFARVPDDMHDNRAAARRKRSEP